MVEEVLCNNFYKGSWVQFPVREGFSFKEKNNFWRWIPDRIWTTMLKYTYQKYFFSHHYMRLYEGHNTVQGIIYLFLRITTSGIWTTVIESCDLWSKGTTTKPPWLDYSPNCKRLENTENFILKIMVLCSCYVKKSFIRKAVQWVSE